MKDAALALPPVPDQDENPTRMEHLSGRTIKGYELHSQVGMGGFGAVYRAYQPSIGRDVAIKVVLPRYANHPDFIRRFDVEAQLVARLEHPSIVPLYDYWRDPGGAYLVMRWLRGGSLAGIIKPMPIDAIIRLLDQIGAALAVAHRRGVVHRDLKPANILLDEEGNAYLADFGIAKDLGKGDTLPANESELDDDIIGSPSYLAPEQIRRGPISPQTDIYSLGIVLYEMLAGSRPFQSPARAELLLKHLYEPLPPLVIPWQPGLADKLYAVLQKATAKQPAERYADIPAMLMDFRAAVGLSSRPPAPLLRAPLPEPTPTLSTRSTEATLRLGIDLPDLENPYKGLRAFQEADVADFFGREALTAQILARLAEQADYARFLAVVGPSGSGKSSIVRAGVIPALRQGRLPGSEKWFVVPMIPGHQPLGELERALLAVAVDPPQSLLELMKQDELGLLQAVNRVLPDDHETDLVLVIDQFEEVFTLVEDEAERIHLLKSLHAAMTVPESRLRLIITMRADFYDRPLLYPGFSEMVRQRSEVIVPLTPVELEQIIERPAVRVGVLVEPALIATIIDEFGQQPGGLPLLQYALTDLFERRTGNLLTLEAYKQSGGVLQALARRADELYAGLSAQEQEECRQLFLRLITLDEGSHDTRRRILRTELATIEREAGAMDRVIDAFSTYRLITLDRDPATRSPTVEVAHEALIRTWGRLRDWIRTSRQHLHVQRRLLAAATEWDNARRDPSFLASGARLAQFEALAAESDLALSRVEHEYLQASISEWRRQEAIERERQAQELALQKRATDRMRYLVLVLALFLVVALGLSLFAFEQRRLSQQHEAEARHQRTEAIRQREQAVAQRLATEARILMQVDGDRNLAALLSIRSMRMQYSNEGDEALLKASTLEYPEQLFSGHADDVQDIAFAHNGSAVLTGSSDGTARLWDVQTGRTRHVFMGHEAAVTAVAFSPDGNTIVTGSADTSVRLWDARSGKPLRQLHGHEGVITCVRFSPQGNYVLTGSSDATARLWDVQTGTSQELRQFRGHEEAITSVAFSSDGNYVLTGSSDATARLWSTHTSQEIRQFAAHATAVVSVAFSPDGDYVLTGSNDTTARLWDVQSGEELRQFIGHEAPVLQVAFSPDGETVLTGSSDTSVRLWDANTGEERRAFNVGTVSHLAFAPDGRQVLTTGSSHLVQLWDMQAHAGPPRFTGHDAGVMQVRFSPDGDTLLTGGSDGTARLWDAQSGEELRQLRGYQPAGKYSLAFSPDGNYIAALSSDGTAHLWHTWVESQQQVFASQQGALVSLALSPDSKTMLTGSSDGSAYLWDARSGRLLHMLVGHTQPVTAVAFSPDGAMVLTGSNDGTARLWDARSGRREHRLIGHADAVQTVQFSPDGATVLTGSADHTARLWDRRSGEELHVLTGHTDQVTGAQFSPDGATVLTGSADHTARLWDRRSGEALHVLNGHANEVNAVAFSPDGRLVLTGSTDQTARLWDRQTGAELRRFSGHSRGVNAVAFSPDGRLVLTGSADTTARLWYTHYDAAIRHLCTRLTRDFSQEEQAQYNLDVQQPTCPAGLEPGMQ